MYYSYRGNFPQQHGPDRIRLSDGTTRTDLSTFTPEQLADAGYVMVEDPPPYNNRTEKLEFVGGQWSIIPLTDNEKMSIVNNEWKRVRGMRDSLISDAAWRVERHQSEVRLGLSPTDNLADLDNYIQSLRDITKQPDPFNLEWPSVDFDLGQLSDTN